MKASNASSAAALVSAIQISCNARLAFGCWLFGNLAITFAVLCTQQRWLARFRPDLTGRLPEPERHERLNNLALDRRAIRHRMIAHCLMHLRRASRRPKWKT